jgi:23S rRNA (guanosine2251-2'-O)-methyltransferase
MEQKDFVFGIQPVIETLKAGTAIDKIFLQKEILGKSPNINEITTLANEQKVYISKVPLEKLNRITRKNHQGVIAFISAVEFVSLGTLIQNIFEEGKTPLVLILDSITDVRNFGAICRTAECAGVHAVVVPLKGAAQINSDAMKTSAGALNYIPICKESSLLNTVKYLQNSGLQVVACTEKTDKLMYEVNFEIPTAIIMGSEETGIVSELLKKADVCVKIPMIGKIESLNVSVASSIITYEAVRQRIAKKI